MCRKVWDFIRKHWVKISAIVAILTWIGISPSSFISVLKFVFNLISTQIPNWIFRFLLIILLGGLLFITIKLFKLLKTSPVSGEDFSKHKDANKKFEDEEIKKKIWPILRSISNRYKEYEKLEPNDEICFILKLIANEDEREMLESDVMTQYFYKFNDRNTADFNIVLDLLNIKKFIRDTTGYGGSYGEMPFEITSDGFHYLRIRKIDEASQSRKSEESPPDETT